MRRAIALAGLAAALSLLSACGSDRARPAPGCLAAGAGCGSNADCCSYGCAPPFPGDPPVCQCNPLPGGLCATTGDCCNSTYGTVSCRDNQCLGVCRDVGEGCTSGPTQCCSGYCNPARQCAPPCRTFGQSCTLSNDCCAGMGCPGGTCSFGCGTSGAACAGDGQCCSGWFCGGGVCVQGTCSGMGLPCGSNDQCCQSPRKLKCDAGTGTCECGPIGATCADDLDCCSGFTCRTGAAPGSPTQCHPAAPRVDGSACIDPSDCTNTCVVPAAQTIGSCCTAKNGACSSGICCAPSVCLSGVQTCQDCLNAGTATGAATDCCQALDYLGGKCCYPPATACLADGECCPVSGKATFCATTAASGASTVCCSGYDTLCDASHPCCSGYACDGGLCKVAPGEACTPAVTDCRLADSCFNGTCCQHPTRPCSGPATGNPQCCTGLCPAGTCAAAGPGGTCATTADCATGGSFCNLGTQTCCAVVTQACAVAADCCEVNSLCAVPTGGATLTCCRPLQASATTAGQCCSNNVSAGKCCAPLKAACATSNDCCAATGVTCPGTGLPGAFTCCIARDAYPPGADATLCCSGTVRGTGQCN